MRRAKACLCALLACLTTGATGVWARSDVMPASERQDARPEVRTERVVSAFADLELTPWEAAPDGALSLRVTIVPDKGIRIYAPGQPGYLPVAVTFGDEAGVKPGKLELPAAESYVFEPTGERFLVYVGTFTAIQHVALVPDGAAERLGRIPATVHYQACDDRVCYKPQAVPLVWTRRAFRLQ